MAANESAFRDAANEAADGLGHEFLDVTGLAEPPYGIRGRLGGLGAVVLGEGGARIAPQTSCASSADAVSPVPIAQIGS